MVKARLKLHLKGAFCLIGTIACAIISYMFIKAGFNEVHFDRGLKNFGTFTFGGLSLTFGLGFLICFLGYLHVLLAPWRMQRMVKKIRSENRANL
ncbi:hypothetical protein FIU96_11320 [Marinobacter sp. THAF39]|nr:hypothetical protein FIV08_11405 [Marinobacter sp. THAF197a]QFT51220.1 hypothetical protein FIU96_11320 [Marinobacter sp. THAF39]